jgi:hypothetical protein
VLLAGIVCWLLPNTQQLTASYQPVIVPDNNPLRPARLSWQAGPLSAVVTGLALGIALLGLSTISRFIYFQF